MNIVNPRFIPESALPLFVLSDDRRSFIGWGIKNHSRGSYNHSMVMHRPGYFASQDFGGYREVKVEKYMKPSIILKFWQYKDMPIEVKKYIIDKVYKDLKAPWYRKMYDFLGILGQLIPGRWTRKINIPWANYCSERVGGYLRSIPMKIPLHPSPTDLNRLFKKTSKMLVYGRWLSAND